MKLTFYLFSSRVKEFDQALIRSKLEGDDPFVELPTRQPLPFEAKAYFQKNRPTPPKWLGFIAGYFDLNANEILNQTNSFLLLVKVQGRVFAITTGFGFTAIERSKIESGFGLRVTLNEVDPQRIKGIDVRKIDVTTRQKRVLINRNSPLYDFEFDLDEDLLNLISGQPRDEVLARKLTGSDSLSITATMTLENIGAKCEALLQSFMKDDYKTNFAFIDHLRIVKDDGLKQQLDTQLAQALENRSAEKIMLAYPELDNLNQVECFKLNYAREHDSIEELDLVDVYNFLDNNDIADVDPKDFGIVGLDHDNRAVTERYSLYECTVFETDFADKKYILSLGRWFELADDYVQQINMDLAAIEEIVDLNFLPVMRKGQKEGDYNSQAAQAKGLALLDKDNYPAGGPSKIEVCDLLSQQREFICVKKYNSSSTLSHLFSQGFVSAEVFDESLGYRQFILGKCPPGWAPLFDVAKPDKSAITFVFAIASESAGKVAEALPFFSKVNLRRAYRSIQKLGFKVKLYKIAFQ